MQSCLMDYLSELKHILKSHKLSVTDCRLAVLGHMRELNRTISLSDLEKEFDQFDRVTLYRTIKLFAEHGLIHKVPSDSGYATYGVSRATCAPNESNHDHMHFKCTACGKMECLELHVPTVEVPGYLINNADVILSGVCKICLP